MGKRVERKDVEVVECDICGKELEKWSECDGCGKIICKKCKEKGYGVYYAPGVGYYSGLQGFFCKECDNNPPEHVKEKHRLYREIQQIEWGIEKAMEEFADRADEAEIKLKKCFNQLYIYPDSSKPVTFPRKNRKESMWGVFLKKRRAKE